MADHFLYGLHLGTLPRCCRFVFIAVAFLYTPLHAAERTSFDVRLDRWLQDLESEKDSTRATALRNLCQIPPWRLTTDRSCRLLRIATRKFPDVNQAGVDWSFEGLSTSEALVRIVATRSRDDHIPVIQECFEAYTPGTRAEALDLLADRQSRASALAAMGLISKFAKQGGIPRVSFWGWHGEAECIEVFFPEVFKFVDQPGFEDEILRLVGSYLDEPESLEKIGKLCRNEVLTRYRVHQKQVQFLLRKKSNAVYYTARYRPHRAHLETILNLFLTLRSQETDEELHQVLHLRDPRLKQAAALVLLQLGEPPDAKVWEEIAASSETRTSLMGELADLDRMDLFPPKYLNQALLAESELVRWLVDRSERAAAPAAIELVKVVTLDPRTETGLLDFYIFKFSMEPRDPTGRIAWKAGIAGPYSRVQQPTHLCENPPHSEFQPLDEKFPESHLGDIQALLRDYRLRAGIDD